MTIKFLKLILDYVIELHNHKRNTCERKLTLRISFLVNTVDFEGNYGLQYSCYYIGQVAHRIMY